ncbi:hypothetical protein QFZ76_007829 [Streptomyces sp. V4I2]|nr:hypothetical protein [Streptomyces sp. V4I2]
MRRRPMREAPTMPTRRPWLPMPGARAYSATGTALASAAEETAMPRRHSSGVAKPLTEPAY